MQLAQRLATVTEPQTIKMAKLSRELKAKGIYAGKNRFERLVIPWDWRRYLLRNINTEVETFLLQMKEKGDMPPGQTRE